MVSVRVVEERPNRHLRKVAGYLTLIGVFATARQFGRRVGNDAYIDNCLKVLKADKKAIFTAASQAAKATGFLVGLQAANITEAAA